MANVYVSPLGSDAGNGTAADPWETISHAVTRVSELGLVGQSMTSDCNIHIAQGLNRIAAKVSIGAALSGQNGYKLRFVGTGRPGTSRILASTRATGWTVHAGNVWKCDAGTTPIHTIYDNGRRAYKGRWPKRILDPAFPLADGPFIRAEDGTDGTMIQYPALSMDPGSWGDISQLEVVVDSGGSFIWFRDVVPDLSINTGTRQITLSRSTRYDIMRVAGIGSRFYVQNALALVTNPGEFFHDPDGISGPAGTLYYYPWTGIDPNLLAIELPLMQTAFELVGTSAEDGEQCHDVEFSNLTIGYTDFTNDYTFAWRLEGESGEGHVYGAYDRIATRPEHRQGIITLTDCERISIRNVELGHAGYSAIHEFGFNKNHIFVNVWGHHTGMNCHYREGGWPGEGDVSRDNLMRNVLASNCGELLCHGAGFVLVNSGHNVHENIEAQQCAGQAHFIVSYAFGGGGFPAPTAADVYAHGNEVSLVKARNVCQNRGDAAVYGIGGIGSLDETPLVNYLDGLDADGATSSADMYDVANVGIYTDNATDRQDFGNCKFANIPGPKVFDQPENGHQTYVNVDGISEGFDPDLVPPCGVTRAFPFD